MIKKLPAIQELAKNEILSIFVDSPSTVNIEVELKAELPQLQIITLLIEKQNDQIVDLNLRVDSLDKNVEMNILHRDLVQSDILASFSKWEERANIYHGIFPTSITSIKSEVLLNFMQKGSGKDSVPIQYAVEIAFRSEYFTVDGNNYYYPPPKK